MSSYWFKVSENWNSKYQLYWQRSKSDNNKWVQVYAWKAFFLCWLSFWNKKESHWTKYGRICSKIVSVRFLFIPKTKNATEKMLFWRCKQHSKKDILIGQLAHLFHFCIALNRVKVRKKSIMNCYNRRNYFRFFAEFSVILRCTVYIVW